MSKIFVALALATLASTVDCRALPSRSKLCEATMKIKGAKLDFGECVLGDEKFVVKGEKSFGKLGATLIVMTGKPLENLCVGVEVKQGKSVKCGEFYEIRLEEIASDVAKVKIIRNVLE